MTLTKILKIRPQEKGFRLIIKEITLQEVISYKIIFFENLKSSFRKVRTLVIDDFSKASIEFGQNIIVVRNSLDKERFYKNKYHNGVFITTSRLSSYKFKAKGRVINNGRN
jgi:hypothetical protein